MADVIGQSSIERPGGGRGPGRTPGWRPTLVLMCTGLMMACGRAAVSGPGAIPWVDHPIASSPLVGSAAAARPCQAADLQVVVGRSGAYHGPTQELGLVSHASDACYLAGAPRVQLVNADASGHVDLGSSATQRVDLAPGQSVLLVIGHRGPRRMPGSWPSEDLDESATGPARR